MEETLNVKVCDWVLLECLLLTSPPSNSGSPVAARVGCPLYSLQQQSLLRLSSLADGDSCSHLGLHFSGEVGGLPTSQTSNFAVF